MLNLSLANSKTECDGMGKVKTFHLLANGFTMVELLVAVLVLSIGLLGLAGLQAAGLRNNQSAYLRSQATILAYDVADRMRATRAAAAAGAYNISVFTLLWLCRVANPMRTPSASPMIWP